MRFLLALWCILLAQTAFAATVPSQVLRINFLAEKVSHFCIPLAGPVVIGGECGPFLGMEFGRSYPGFLEFHSFVDQGDGSFIVDANGGRNCEIAFTECVFEVIGILDPKPIIGPNGASLVFLDQCCFNGGFLNFDFISGTGQGGYVDDELPISSETILAFSNVSLKLVPVPVSPSVIFLAIATVLIGAFGRVRNKRDCCASF